MARRALDSKKIELEAIALDKKLQSEKIDVTTFNNELSCGAAHPVAETMNRIINYFLNLNFTIEEGPLVEDDFHNFQALNLPEYHPARDMADTFYNKDYTLLRTHTSPVSYNLSSRLQSALLLHLSPHPHTSGSSGGNNHKQKRGPPSAEPSLGRFHHSTQGLRSYPSSLAWKT